MSPAAPASDVKRAKPSLNVYTGLLTVSLLIAIFGVTVIAMQNADVSSKQGISAVLEVSGPATGR